MISSKSSTYYRSTTTSTATSLTLDSRAFSGLPVAGNSDGLSPGLTVIDDVKRCRENMDPEGTATRLHGSGMPPDCREETRKGVSDAVDGSTGAARDSEVRIDGC